MAPLIVVDGNRMPVSPKKGGLVAMQLFGNRCSSHSSNRQHNLLNLEANEK